MTTQSRNEHIQKERNKTGTNDYRKTITTQRYKPDNPSHARGWVRRV
jgi:hypothetical protein